MIKCPKCGVSSGDDWTQCHGNCPMPASPYFNQVSHVYVVVMHEAPRQRLRADVHIYDVFDDAVKRQVELGTMNYFCSWIMSFPDPRLIAND